MRNWLVHFLCKQANRVYDQGMDSDINSKSEHKYDSRCGYMFHIQLAYPMNHVVFPFNKPSCLITDDLVGIVNLRKHTQVINRPFKQNQTRFTHPDGHSICGPQQRTKFAKMYLGSSSVASNAPLIGL